MSKNEDKDYLIDPNDFGQDSDAEGAHVINIQPNGVIYQAAPVKTTTLCDCSGNYCKYCWLTIIPCTFPYVFYKIPKALKLGQLAKWLLAFSILMTVFKFGVMPIQHSLIQTFQQQNVEQKMAQLQREYPGMDTEQVYEQYPILNPENALYQPVVDISQIPPAVVYILGAGLLITSLVVVVMLTIVRQKYKKTFRSEDNCCASCCEVAWCTPCIAGQMGKDLEHHKFDI
jgi:hypothetical protein